MFTWLFPLTLLLAPSSSASPPALLVLSDSSWPSPLPSPLLLQFYAPWCGHCKKLEPEYAQVAQKLSVHTPPVHVAKVDAVESPKTAAEFNITGFPTILFLDSGLRQEYRGVYTAEALEKWVLHKVDPPVTVLDSVDKLEGFLTGNKVAAVLFDNVTSEGYLEFERAAQLSEHHFYAVSTSAESLEKYEVQTSSLVVFKPFDEKKVVFNGTLSASSVSSFVSKSSAPWVSLWNDTVISYVFTDHNPIALVLYPYFRNTYYRAVMDDIAPAVKDSIKFAYTDLETTDGYKLADYLGLDTQPTAMILDWVEGRLVKYTFTAESLNKETLREFIETWKSEQLVPFYKSERPAEKQGLVRRLTGKDFVRVLEGSKSATVVLFHQPWCAQCGKAVSVMESVAKAGTEVALFDVGANELPGETFERVPLARLYEPGGKVLREFEGEWTEEAVRKFVGEVKTEL